MHLKDILKGVEFKTDQDVSKLNINSITADSRAVRSGDLFIAVRGYSQNGVKFIKDAAAKGAKIIIAEKDFAAPRGTIKILVRDTRSAVSIIADNFYGHPSQKLKMTGVTGTNGKTTITYLIENIIKRTGHGAGVIGTINYRLKDKIIPAKNTTPGPLELQSMLSEMVKVGLDYGIMEVSSHSLDQNRVEDVWFDVAVFTNITSDHLDYHKTADNYFRAKTRIFNRLKPRGIAILNNDDEKVASLKSSIKRKVITYGIKNKSDIMAKNIKLSMGGSIFNVIMFDTSFRINTKLTGMHNVSNIIASIASAFALGIGVNAIRDGVESLIFVPGRLEEVNHGQPFKVFVDYAHTEDALYNILRLLRQVAARHIITVFGCGGDRDKTKRPLMGIAACKISDHVIITSDNPRYEDPSAIINGIENGIRKKFSNYEIIADRRSAIRKALEAAGAGDIVLIAGKGHEDYQIIKDKVMPFDDRVVVKTILKERYAGKRYSEDNRRVAGFGRS